jgi:hypothetical protein
LFDVEIVARAQQFAWQRWDVWAWGWVAWHASVSSLEASVCSLGAQQFLNPSNDNHQWGYHDSRRSKPELPHSARVLYTS